MRMCMFVQYSADEYQCSGVSVLSGESATYVLDLEQRQRQSTLIEQNKSGALWSTLECTVCCSISVSFDNTVKVTILIANCLSHLRIC